MYDAVIVGARCAGSPLAMLLARAGHDILLVDRATFPSDTMSTHFIQLPGMARLTRWGLADDVFNLGAPSVTKVNFSVAGDVLPIDIPLHPSLPGLAAPRRTVMDKLLVDKALEAGAHIETGVSVDSLIRDGDRVVGVRGHSSDGDFEARARIVVGADGRNSVVAREIDPGFVQSYGPSSSGYYTYYSGLEIDAPEAYLHDGLFCIVFPTNDGLVGIGVAWPNENFKEIKRDIEGNFLSALDELGDIGARARAAERKERFVGLADVPNFLRKGAGPGWALVGDAVCHKDPAPADGMSDAFRGAEFLADSIDSFLSGRQDESDALADYDRRHGEILKPLLDAAVRTATFDLTPQQRFEAFIEIRMHDAEEMEKVLATPAST